MIAVACVCISERLREDAQSSSIGIHPAIIRAALYLTPGTICTKRQAKGSRIEVEKLGSRRSDNIVVPMDVNPAASIDLNITRSVA